MKYYIDLDKEAEIELNNLREHFKSKKIKDEYIRKIIALQKGELSILSNYYSGNIAEANWSLIENDEKIKKLDKNVIDDTDKPKVDALDVILGIDDYSKKIDTEKYRKYDAEYTYVFLPSYYAVKILILYYIKNRTKAKRIYGLKNSVVRRENKRGIKFYGGLPFILKYMRKIGTRPINTIDIKADFADVMQELFNCKAGLELNGVNDEFINDIIDCINNSYCRSFIIEKRIRDYKEDKEKFYTEFKIIDDYRILMHRDVEKDWEHLQEGYKKKANEIIDNTPKFPKNIPPKNDPLSANIKGWFSQRVSHKDRVVYKKDAKEKIVYIATVCDHYKDAPRRSKSIAAYK